MDQSVILEKNLNYLRWLNCPIISIMYLLTNDIKESGGVAHVSDSHITPSRLKSQGRKSFQYVIKVLNFLGQWTVRPLAVLVGAGDES